MLGVIHGAARFLPELISHFATEYPDMIVKRTAMGRSDVDTSNMAAYRDLVRATFCAGTFRCGPMMSLSLVGTRSEETGGFFPEFLDLLESSALLRPVMPWGRLSRLHGMERDKSNDGPILWARPGEQVVPTADLGKSPLAKKRSDCCLL